MDRIEQLVVSLRGASPSERSAILEELRQLCTGPQGAEARSRLERLARGEVLEIQWELEELLEEVTPKPAKPAEPPPPKEEPPPESKGSDQLELVYDDPRGLMLHRTRDGSRWFATQVDPRTGQPQTFEIPPSQVAQVQAQLAGSPYWVLGKGPR